MHVQDAHLQNFKTCNIRLLVLKENVFKKSRPSIALNCLVGRLENSQWFKSCDRKTMFFLLDILIIFAIVTKSSTFDR
jgi:hypothetical protein